MSPSLCEIYEVKILVDHAVIDIEVIFPFSGVGKGFDVK